MVAALPRLGVQRIQEGDKVLPESEYVLTFMANRMVPSDPSLAPPDHHLRTVASVPFLGGMLIVPDQIIYRYLRRRIPTIVSSSA